ncbi:MAG: hypothetical protein O2962_01210 [Cyanobacteria bacterium]|nr:hypothetical protein [Cyanobacteriota bacterium]
MERSEAIQTRDSQQISRLKSPDSVQKKAESGDNSISERVASLSGLFEHIAKSLGLGHNLYHDEAVQFPGASSVDDIKPEYAIRQIASSAESDLNKQDPYGNTTIARA